jgi:hypothetical protein
VLFGVDLSAEQLAGIEIAVVALVGLFYVRPTVYVKDTVARIAEKSARTGDVPKDLAA